MKKGYFFRSLLVLTLVLLLMLSATACNGSDSGNNTTNTTPTGTSSTGDDEGYDLDSIPSGGMNEPVECDIIELTVTGKEVIPGDDTDKATDGYELVKLSLKIKNVSDEAFEYSPSLFNVIDSTGTEVAYFNFFNPDNITKYLMTSGTLEPGQEVSGTVVYQLPKGDANSLLIFIYDVDEGPLLKVTLK